MPLETFEARTRLRCCGTCREWTLINRRTTWCPKLETALPDDDLTSTGCDAWQQEPRETFALELIERLKQAGAE